MFGIISSETYFEDIQYAIGEVPLYQKVGKFNNETFLTHINAAIRVSLNTLIIDVTCTDDESIYKGLKLYKIQRSEVRIILFAPSRKPGDLLISQLVGLSVWDIVAPELPEVDDMEEEFIFEVAPFIEEKIKFPATYGDAVRWHTSTQEAEIQSNSSNVVTKTKIKEKIVYRDKIINKSDVIVEQKIVAIPNNTIAIINLSKKAGSSFLTLNLAQALSEQEVTVSILENPMFVRGKTYLFDILGMEGFETEERKFYSVPHIINKNDRVNVNKVILNENIEFLISDPREGKIDSWTYENTLKYLNSAKHSVRLLDIGDVYNNEPDFDCFSKVIEEVDHILVVVDPLPHEMLSNIDLFDYLTELKNANDNIHYIYNKWNDGIDEKIISQTNEQFRYSVKIPALDLKYIYKSFFKQEIPYKQAKAKELLVDPLTLVIEKIYPQVTLEKPKKARAAIFKKLWK